MTRARSAEDLERLFVGRHAALVEVVDDFAETAEAGGARFEAVHGPRGAGKSHFVAVAADRLAVRLASVGGIVVRLDDDEYPANFTDFVSRLIRRLPPSDEGPTPEAQLANLRAVPAAGREERAVEMLRAVVGRRPVVLVLESLDRLFDAMGVTGQQRLRRMFGDARRWSVLATTCTWPRSLDAAAAPFFQTFARRLLPPFSDGDAVDMLLALSRQHGNRELEKALTTAAGTIRVRAIRLLLGDKPRTMALIFPHLQTRSLDELDEIFAALSAELTPHFQDQMSRLPPGRRVYVEQLATSRGPLSVRELAERVFDTQQTASGQLRYLADDHLVQCARVGRESFYELADPLHRLAAAMKHPDPSPVCLARFLVSWLERAEIDGADPGLAAALADPSTVTSAWTQRLAAHPDAQLRLALVFGAALAVHPGAMELRARLIALAESGMFGELGGACLLAVAALPGNPVPFRRLPAEARATLRVQLDSAPTRHLLASVA